MGKKLVKVLGFSAKESQFVVKSKDFSLTLNNEVGFVTSKPSSSVEFLLANLAGSIHAVGKAVAKEQQLNLRSIQLEISGEIEASKWETSEKRGDVGFKTIHVVIKPTSSASIVALKKWMDSVKNRCPVYANMNKSTAVILTLVKEYDVVNVA